MALKRAYIFDFDETLVITDAKIHVYRNGVYVKSMNSKQYNFYKRDKNDTLDFSDFNDPELVVKAKKYKMWPVISNVNKAVKEDRSTSDIYILTARSPIIKSAIYEFLKKNGIDININNILTIGDSEGRINISEEKKAVLRKLAQKYNDVVFFDDDPKNIQLAQGIKNVRTRLVENVGAPMATLGNVPGIGNAVPAGPGNLGSGDLFGASFNKKPYTQSSKTKRKKRIKTKAKTVKESNINPYDKIGMTMAKKMKIKPPFQKKTQKENQNAMKQQKFEHKIITLDEFVKEINETERPLYDARQDWKDMMKRDKKSLLSELSQLYRIHAANEKTSKQEIISAILDAKHSRWSAEPSDFKKKVNEQFDNFDEYTPLTAYEVSGATFRDSDKWETTVADLRKGKWNIDDEDFKKLKNGETIALYTRNLAGTPRKLVLQRADIKN